MSPGTVASSITGVPAGSPARPVRDGAALAGLVTVSAVVVQATMTADPAAGEPDALVVAGLRALGLLAACGTVGGLVLALLLRRDPAAVRRHTAWAGGWAGLWAVTALGWAVAVAVASGAGPLVHAAPGEDAAVLAGVVRTAVVMAWTGGVVVVLTRNATSPRVVLTTLGVTLTGVVATVLSGHSAHGDNPVPAVASMVLHVAAVTVWVGGVTALALVRTGPGAAEAARRFSPVALGCFVALAGSGVLNLATRFSWPALAESGDYAVLLGAKAVVLLTLGVAGALHRGRTIRRLEQGRASAFWLLVTGETLLMATALGFAVVLARTGA